MAQDGYPVRLANPDDADVVAELLIEFNAEFDTPSPDLDVVASRLRSLLDVDSTVVIVAGEPVVGLAVITFRPNVWYEGEVALLDELYVVPDLRDQGIGSSIVGVLLDLADERGAGLIEINVDEADVDAQRFYERHGFAGYEPTTGERAFYYHREL